MSPSTRHRDREVRLRLHPPVRELAPRAPGDDEVAIDVAYSGINFADIQMRLGFYPDAPKKPFVPGYEVSGTVAAVGKNVTRRRAPAIAVVAGTYFGGYASHVTIPARQVFKLPAAIDLAAGAALPVNYFTAQLALFEMARVRARRSRADRVRDRRRRRARDPDGAPRRRRGHRPDDEPAQEGASSSSSARRRTRVDEFRADASAARLRLHPQRVAAAREINWQRARLGITGRMVCLGISSGVKDGKRNFLRIALAALRMPRISVLKLFDANTGIYALNALHVLARPGVDRAAHAVDGRRRGDGPRAARRQGVPRRPRSARRTRSSRPSRRPARSCCLAGANVTTGRRARAS